MTSQETLRCGTTITHNGEPFTVLRVAGGTVVARDLRGHTRHVWKSQVLEAIEGSEASTVPVEQSPSEVTIHARGSLGVTAPKPPTTVPSELDETAAYLHDVEEYLRELFGERARPRELPARPQPLVHLFAAPESTPPQAA
jgi:hypothetical protein